MRHQATAFLVRSLRQESRLISHHTMRAGLAALIMVLLLLQVLSLGLRSGAGGAFASTVLFCCYGFVTVLGGVYFSTAIVEEKEEQTLPLLRMTGASSFSILLGKSIPRLVSVVLLILVTTPFIMLSVTLGGTVLRGIVTAILGILAYSIMLCQIGLFASLISNDAQRAFAKMLLVWGTVEFLPFWCGLISWTLNYQGNFQQPSVLQYFRTHGVFEGDFYSSTLQGILWDVKNCAAELQIWAEPRTLVGNLNVYLGGFANESVWRAQMTTHLIVSIFFFGLSWLLFGRFTIRCLAEGGEAVKSRGQSRNSKSVSRRVWSNAICWKSWQYVGGGWKWFWIRLLGVPTMVTGIVVVASLALEEKLESEDLGLILFVVGLVMIVANVAIVFGRLLNLEVQQRTLSTLMLLPFTTNSIVNQNTLGVLPTVLASASCFLVGVTLLLMGNTNMTIPSLHNWLREPWFYAILAWAICTVYFGLLISIRLRYGGMLFAIVLFWMVVPIMLGSCLNILLVGVNGRVGRTIFEYVVPLMWLIPTIPLCIGMHLRILRSLEKVGEEA